VDETRALLDSDSAVCDPVLAFVDAWCDGDLGLLLAAVGHHGKPATREKVFVHWLWNTAHGRSPAVGIAALVERCRAWFPRAFVADGRALPACPQFQHGFAGVVMLADWIASDRSAFSFGDGTDRAAFARATASEMAFALHLDLSRARAYLRGQSIDLPTLLDGHAPRALQSVVYDAPLPAMGTVEVLEAETGSGKTEAAYLRFLQLHQAGLVDGLYFALPTRTAATQLHARLTHLTARMFGANPAHRPPVVLAVPGYLRVDDVAGHKLADFEVLWDDHDAGGNKARKWAAEHPKCYLAAPIAVGTIDQVLLAALQVKHAHLRATALLRNLLVVDEVHASDAYMGAILQHVLGWHIRAGGRALLLSATLGDSMRSRLTGQRVGASLDQAIATSYPLFRSGDHTTAIPSTSEGKAVTVEVQPWIDEVESVAARASQSARQGAKVLIIRNTVAACIATQRAVEAALSDAPELLFRVNGLAAPHHSRFAREDRELLDRAIEGSFGKDADRDRGCVAVATQTVQQSLDLDADLLITDLCPIDVLLQRIGRLHRHARVDRAAPFQSPRALVLVPEARDLGTFIEPRSGDARGPAGFGSVYDDLRILEATWQQIERVGVWEIPAMNRELVERATHPKALEAVVVALGGAWRKHEEHCLGATAALRSQAHVGKLPWHLPIEDCAFPGNELREVRTRLGADDRVMELSARRLGAFGVWISRLNLPGWMTRGIDASAVAQDSVDGDGNLRLAYGHLALRYDRFGLRRVDAEPDTGGLDG